MEILAAIEELSRLPGPIFLAIGVFDGVHLGHQAVIGRAVHDAAAARGTAVVLTFDPHPARLLRPESAPRLLTATAHKVRLLRSLGVQQLLVLPFDAALAATPPAEFIRRLAACCRPLAEICVGHSWSFGAKRAGNLQLLEQLGHDLGFAEIGVPAVEIEGEIISSTLIRQAVEEGELGRAEKLLGRPFTVLGTVQAGAQLGRQLGYPTANLRTHHEQFPPNGVYAVRAQMEGETIGGVANIGFRPTLRDPKGERLLEVHLFDFARTLYGKDLEVRFIRFLRPERQFTGLDELRVQIEQDAAAARQALA